MGGEKSALWVVQKDTHPEKLFVFLKRTVGMKFLALATIISSSIIQNQEKLLSSILKKIFQ